MKAAIIKTYGPPEVITIEDIAIPPVAADEVLIRVAASSFNPADAAIRSGAFKEILPVTLPHTLGADAAGIVEKIGAAVSEFHEGDRVYTYLDFMKHGGLAEFVIAKTNEVAHAPSGLSLGDAAVIPAAGSTAWQALFVHANLKQGQKILITGASGGVGTFAVQLARWKGAVVTGCASAKQETLLRNLGASEFIDYTKGDICQAGSRMSLNVSSKTKAAI